MASLIYLFLMNRNISRPFFTNLLLKLSVIEKQTTKDPFAIPRMLSCRYHRKIGMDFEFISKNYNHPDIEDVIWMDLVKLKRLQI